MLSPRIVVAAGSLVAAAALTVGVVSFNSACEAAQPESKAPASGAAGKVYALDAVHTSVVFKIKHMNASNFYGRFNKASGTFSIGDTLGIDVSVPTDSVDTANAKRDADIKAPDYLDAKAYPEIKLVATDLKKSGEVWKGTAQLTFRGVTKPIELEVHQTGAGKGMGGKDIAGIESTFTIKRSEFGAKVNERMLSDEVTLIVAAEGIAK